MVQKRVAEILEKEGENGMQRTNMLTFDGKIRTSSIITGRKAEHLGTDAGGGDDGPVENFCVIVQLVSEV